MRNSSLLIFCRNILWEYFFSYPFRVYVMSKSKSSSTSRCTIPKKWHDSEKLSFFFDLAKNLSFHVKAYFQCFPSLQIQWHQFHSTAWGSKFRATVVDDSFFQYKSINFVYLENSGKDSLLQPWYGSQFCAFCKIGVCLLSAWNQFHQRTTNQNIFTQNCTTVQGNTPCL